MHAVEVVTNLTDNRALADACACGDQRQFALADTAQHLVEARILGLVADSWVLEQHLQLNVVTADDAVGAELLGARDGVRQFERATSQQHVVRVLQLEVGDVCLASGEQRGNLFDCLAACVVHVERKDNLVEAGQPLEILGDELAGGLRAVRHGDHGHGAAEHLVDGMSVVLTLGDDHDLAALVPQVHPVEGQLLGVTSDTEVLAFVAQLLGDHVAVLVEVLGDLNRLAVLVRPAHVAPPLARSQRETTGLEFAGLTLQQLQGAGFGCLNRGVHGGGRLGLGGFVMSAPRGEAVSVTVGVVRQVVFAAALRTCRLEEKPLAVSVVH